MDSGGCDLDLGGTAHYLPPSLVSEHQCNNPPLTVTRKEQTEGRGETPRNYSGSQERRGGAGQKKHQGIPSPVLGELVTVEIQASHLCGSRETDRLRGGWGGAEDADFISAAVAFLSAGPRAG